MVARSRELTFKKPLTSILSPCSKGRGGAEKRLGLLSGALIESDSPTWCNVWLAALCHLSLSQRERIKVRDCFSAAPRARARLPATHCRALGEPDDSKISAL